MKQHLRSLFMLLMLVVWASGSFAQEKTYSYTFGTAANADFTSLNQTKTLNGKSWSLAVDPNDAYITTDTQTKGQQIGSKNSPVKKATYTTSDIPGTIKKVSIEAGNASSVSKTNVSVSVNGVSYGSNDLKANSQDLTTNNFTGNEAGKIEIVFTNTATKGGYRIKSITITYEEGPSKTPTTLDFGFTTKTANINEPFTATATLKANDADLAGKITYESSNKDCATVEPTTGKVTPLAIGTATITAKYVGDDTYAKAEASYTVKVVDPNALEVTFDFSDCTKYGYNKPTSNSKRTELKIGDVIKSSPITITVIGEGSTKNGFGTTYLGVYQGGVLKIEIEKGYVLNEVSFERRGNNNTLKINDNKEGEPWTGEASSVTLSVPEDAKGTQVTSITIKYSKTAVSTPLTLDENADDTNTKIEKNNGKTQDVTLTRSLKAGVWNTICLPFDVTAEQVESVLKATGNVKEFDKDDKATATIYFKPATEIKAGVPYLIKPTEDAKVLNFKDVTINNVDELNRINGNDYCICGVFGKYAMNTNGTELFLNAAGKFVAPAVGKETMKGFRAYFNVPLNVSAAAININIDGETTGINSIETNATVNGKVYNLNGQYVGNSLNGLKKGIYVVNGKKVIK